MLSNNKFLGKCWYGGHPWIRLAMESESMVSNNKVLGTLSHFRWWEKYASQKNYLSI